MTPYVTAELGTNWNGDMQTLEQLVSDCSKANVNAVKLQALSKELVQRHTELAFYEDASVNKSNIKQIDEICRSYSMPWYCTITDIDQLDYVREYCTFAKIRGQDSNKTELVNRTISDFDLTFITSLRPLNIKNKKIVNLYGIPKYPTDFGEINFAMLYQFQGYSNHCMNPLAILRAARAGVGYIELHVTPTREEFAIDNKVSFTPNELEEIMAWLRLR